MNIKKALFASLFAVCALGASAQTVETRVAKDTTIYEHVPHWYAEAKIGGQYTLGEVNFGELISPNAQIAGGYNFNKVFGARLAVNLWQGRGGSDIAGELYKWKFNYIAPTVDVTANLSNLIAGVNPNRLVDISAFLGGGLNISFTNGQAQNAHDAMLAKNPSLAESDQFLRLLWGGSKVRGVAQGGFIADFKVSKKVSVSAELSANLTGDGFNSKKAGNSDWYFNALVGAKYNFGETYKTVKVQAPEKIVYKEKIVEKVVEKVVEKPVEKVVKVNDRPKLHIEIFFNLAGFKLLGSEAHKVTEVANYMKKYPEAKLNVVGLCDKGTGTDATNNPLSVKRANLVKDLLVKKGISADRIITEGKGSTIQPYEVPELNRVAICDAE